MKDFAFGRKSRERMLTRRGGLFGAQPESVSKQVRAAHRRRLKGARI